MTKGELPMEPEMDHSRAMKARTWTRDEASHPSTAEGQLGDVEQDAFFGDD
jgi:hypothetical protein